MPSPVTPNEIKNTLPNVDSGVCDRLKKVIIDFPRKVYAWMSYVYNDDGSFTEEFKQELCQIKCDDIDVGTSGPTTDPTGGGQGGSIPKVTQLIATPATRSTGGIVLVWQHVDQAISYNIYRTPTITVNHASPGTQYAANATNINVEPLLEEVESGKKITFDNGTVLTTNAKAIVGATALSGSLSGVLPDSEEGHLPGADAKLLVKDRTVWTSPNWRQAAAGKICMRSDKSCTFLDEHGMEIWDGSQMSSVDGDNNLLNSLNGGHRYNYFVVGKSRGGEYSAYSKAVGGYSQVVKGFSAVDADTGLIYSGGGDAAYEQTVPNGQSFMRVVLRGGGGGGGAGGDYKEPSAIQYHVKNISYAGGANDTITFTLGGSSTPDINHWSTQVGKNEIRLLDNGNNNFERLFEVISVSGSTFVCKAIAALAGETPTSNGTNIPSTSDASFGRVYRTIDKQKVKVPGGGGGAGGLLVCVFAITNAITKVRVRTIDSTGSPKTVNYSDTGTGAFKQFVGNLSDSIGDEFVTYNRGGEGRQDATTHPTAGEPSTNPGAHTAVAFNGDPVNNDGISKSTLLAPYFTLLEVYNGSSWLEVARVADGQGGGYRNGFTQYRSLGGKGGSTHTTTNVTGCTLRTGALSKLVSGGKFFKAGADGKDGTTPTYFGPEAPGIAGKGGFVWDGHRPFGTNSPLEISKKGDITGNSGCSFDLSAPGSGGSGSTGSSIEEDTKFCIGGHAMAGCAWVTYSTTAYDKY